MEKALLYFAIDLESLRKITMSYGPLDFVGNVGVVVLMSTYLMLQLNKLSSDGLAYSVLNALGAGLIVISLLFNFNLSALLAEIFWVLISLIGIYKYLAQRLLFNKD